MTDQPNPYQIAQDCIDNMRHVTEEINNTIQRLQEMKAEAFTDIDLTDGDILQYGDVMHLDSGDLIVDGLAGARVGKEAYYGDGRRIKVTRRVPAPVFADTIPPDKILVDRAQYERMQADSEQLKKIRILRLEWLHGAEITNLDYIDGISKIVLGKTP